jgi:hypothetical protein
MVYTFITALMWCTSNRQLAAIIESNEISRKALGAGQRAFGNFEGNKINFVDTKGVGPGKVFGVWFRVINNGNTSTKNFPATVMCKSTDIKDLPEPFILFAWDDKRAVSDIIGPKQTKDFGPCNLLPEEVRKLNEGALAMYLLAEVRYRDLIDPGVPHVTQFSQRLYVSDLDEKLPTPKFNWSSDSVGRHNCADDDCPS